MTSNKIKEAAIAKGVDEWFFDAISDNELERYSISEIIDLWVETQNIN